MSDAKQLRPSERPVDWIGPRVLEWNDHAGAVSLTFDDASPSQLSTALPELDARGIKATFYLVADPGDRDGMGKALGDDLGAWRAAFGRGHELGNHSLRHRMPEGFTDEDYRLEISGARDILEKAFGVRPVSYAYPYVAITPRFKELLAADYVGVRGARDVHLGLAETPDWTDLPSVCALTVTPAADYLGRLRLAGEGASWCVFMFHAIEGDPWGWQPVPLATYRSLLDALGASPWLWTDTFANVASYLRAQKACEAAGFPAASQTLRDAKEFGRWTWECPVQVPPGTALKVKLGGAKAGTARVSQGGRVLKPEENGTYLVDFGAGELSVEDR
jgi:peptidoglycan/xylan/chitin deacetylase (PgdA/CDA1 family)